MIILARMIASLGRSPAALRFRLRHVNHAVRIRAREAHERVALGLTVARARAYALAGRQLPAPIGEQRRLLVEFYERFEDLVDLLCVAARFEDPDSYEEEYARLRAIMRRDYPVLRNQLIAYLKLDPSDDALGLRCSGRPTDGFEALFAAQSVRQMLELDEGDLIGRIERTRAALNHYGDSLRRQAAPVSLR